MLKEEKLRVQLSVTRGTDARSKTVASLLGKADVKVNLPIWSEHLGRELSQRLDIVDLGKVALPRPVYS